MKKITLPCGSVALVDDEDFDRLGHHRWRANGNGYVCRETPRPDRRKVYLHREVLGLERGDGLEADHVNRDKLDNRRANLRVATRSQNQQNLPAIGGASRHRGVSRHRDGVRWRAFAQLDGRFVHLGLHATEEQAATAAATFRREHMPYSEDARRAA